jgi:ribosome-binding factor A
MTTKRTVRLNSLLREVISDVIKKQVRNPHINELLTITRVDITNDLHYAKVYVGVIGTDDVKQETVKALQSAAGFIAVNCAKLVVMRYFPELTFKLDDGADKHMRIEELLYEINQEKKKRDAEEATEEEAEEPSE